MTPPMFVVAAEQLAEAHVGGELTLAGDEGRHATRVRRIAVGEAVNLTDGSGTVAAGLVRRTGGRDELTIAVVEVVTEQPPAPQITVVQALIKGDRMDRAVETLTEAGADRIIVWSSTNSVARWRTEQADKSMAKLVRRVAEASKQSRRARFPVLVGPLDTAALMTDLGLAGQSGTAADHSREDRGAALILALDETGADSLADVPLAAAPEIILIVGPEGGFTASEREEFASAGVVAVRMGPTVMRASTAGTVALGAVMAGARRWSQTRAADVSD